MAALRRAIAPQQPDQFGVGFDAGREPWHRLEAAGIIAPPTTDPVDKKVIVTSDRSIKIERAWRVQNQTMWNQYSAGVERIASDISKGPPIDSDGAPGATPAGCTTRKTVMEPAKPGVVGGCSVGGQRLEEAAHNGFIPKADGFTDAARLDVNEAFFLHGTSTGTLKDIVNGGFNERFAGKTGSIFGAGSYFAQDIEKADQYTREGDDRYHSDEGEPLHHLHSELYPGGADDHPGDENGGVCYLLVGRVALGYPIRTNGRYRDPVYGVGGNPQGQYQCVAMDRDASDTGYVFAGGLSSTSRELEKLPGARNLTSGVRYHSLVVETVKRGGRGTVERFREFVSFHDMYSYPEFVVAYRRCNRSQGEQPTSMRSSPDEPEPEPEPEPGF
jgi:hypothetical protein